jgi:tetratricopeptide (TPR) repeat protein
MRREKISQLFIIITIIIFGTPINPYFFRPFPANAADMIIEDRERFFQAYYTQGDSMGWNVELKGKIMVLSADLKIDSIVADKVQENTSASARLYNNIGISLGDVLYIVDDNNLIVGKMKVTSIFKTNTFGYLVIGAGKLRLVNVGNRVVQRVFNEHKQNAFVQRGKGDISQETGETGKAISYYKNALTIDRNNPEAHLSLGYIYLNDDMLEYANNEFKEAEKQERRLYDNEDKYQLYKGLTEVRFKQAYYVKTTDVLRARYIKDGIEYSKKALNIYPDSKEVNYFLGMFYYKNTEPSEVLAKDQMLKVITLDENNIEACLALAELYDKHDNKEKAISYAEQALKIDPANDRAKFLIKKLK